jgi:phage terminase large subunit-like protein
LGGDIIKAAWFKSHAANERPDPFNRIVQSWDTANKATELSDFSVCTTWGVKGKDLYLLHVLRRRMEYPELRRAVREQCEALHHRRADRGQGLRHPADPGVGA